MVERVARRLAELDGVNPDWSASGMGMPGPEDNEPGWKLYEDDAREVIGAMRTPTDWMLVAGARNRTAIGRFYTGDDTLEPEWAAMIDAALEEGK